MHWALISGGGLVLAIIAVILISTAGHRRPRELPPEADLPAATAPASPSPQNDPRLGNPNPADAGSSPEGHHHYPGGGEAGGSPD